MRFTRQRGVGGLRHDLQPVVGERLQIGDAIRGLRARHAGQQDAGELAGQRGHAALGPVAAVPGQHLGHRLDDPGMIIGNDGQYDGRVHGARPGQ